MQKLKLEASPLTEYAQRLEMSGLKKNELMALAHRTNLTNMFLADEKWRVERELNMIVVYYGTPGCGKSTVSLFQSYVAQKLFNINFCYIKNDPTKPDKKLTHVVFNRMLMRNVLGKALPLSKFSLDEAKSKKHGTGSGRFEEELIQIVEQALRGQQIFLDHVSPRLDETIPYHFAIKPIKIDRTKGISQSIISSLNDKGTDLIPMGYILSGKPPMWINEIYRKKKKENMLFVQSGEDKTQIQTWIEDAKTLLKSPEWYNAETKDDKKLIAYEVLPNRTKDEIKLIIKKAEQIEEKENENT